MSVRFIVKIVILLYGQNNWQKNNCTVKISIFFEYTIWLRDIYLLTWKKTFFRVFLVKKCLITRHLLFQLGFIFKYGFLICDFISINTQIFHENQYVFCKEKLFLLIFEFFMLIYLWIVFQKILKFLFVTKLTIKFKNKYHYSLSFGSVVTKCNLQNNIISIFFLAKL